MRPVLFHFFIPVPGRGWLALPVGASVFFAVLALLAAWRVFTWGSWSLRARDGRDVAARDLWRFFLWRVVPVFVGMVWVLSVLLWGLAGYPPALVAEFFRWDYELCAPFGFLSALGALFVVGRRRFVSLAPLWRRLCVVLPVVYLVLCVGDHFSGEDFARLVTWGMTEGAMCPPWFSLVLPDDAPLYRSVESVWGAYIAPKPQVVVLPAQLFEALVTTALLVKLGLTRIVPPVSRHPGLCVPLVSLVGALFFLASGFWRAPAPPLLAVPGISSLLARLDPAWTPFGPQGLLAPAQLAAGILLVVQGSWFVVRCGKKSPSPIPDQEREPRP